MILVFLGGMVSCTKKAKQGADVPRPDHWAKPIQLGGVPNLHKVDDHLYRSGQPTKAGMKNLEKLGIKTIVNLRSFHSDRDEIEGTALGLVHITMKAWHPEDREIIRFLNIAADKEKQPVLVHCWHGADRTGTMCALYRIAVQGWSKEAAIREMTEGGYDFHPVWTNLIRYIKKLDIPSLKTRLALFPG